MAHPIENKNSTLKKTLQKALNSGLSGGTAMAIQVTSLMWMRTIMNYQYRNGSSLKTAIFTLYKEVSKIYFFSHF